MVALEPKSYYEAPFLADFFQEWASARNYFGGLPIYTPQEVTLQLYFGERKSASDTIFNEVNAHPPPSVLLAIPFGKLNYAEAFLLWNEVCLVLFGASVWFVIRGLGMPFSPQGVLAIFTVLLFCNPLLSQVQQGQLTIPLVFLIVVGWRLDRMDRPGLAGVCLGVATALKLFPGFLFLPFLLRRRWSVVIAGVTSFVGLTAATLALLGFDPYQTYIFDVLPEIAKYRGASHNLALCGIWYKLQDPLPHWMPVTFASDASYPFAAACACLALGGFIIAILYRIVRQASNDADLVISASIVALLLVSPITWDHYLLFLLLPIAVLWQRLPRSGLAWPMFLLIAGLLWVEPFLVMEHCLILMGAATVPETGRWLATPLETLTALSVPSYALAGLFVLLLVSTPRRTGVLHSVANPLSEGCQ